MKNNKSKSSFRGKVSKNSEKQSHGNNFGYLHIPKGVNVYSPTPGAKESIDILPYIITDSKHPDIDSKLGIEEGGLWYKRPFKVHRNVGVDNDSVVCLTSFGKKCPICEYRKKRQAEGADKDELKALNTSLRNLYCVVPKGIKKVEEVPHLFDMAQFLFQNLLNEELEEDDSNEVFPDLEEGLTLNIRWSKSSFAGNTFAEAKKIVFDERSETYDESIMEDVPDLDKCLKELTYEEMQKKFFEMEVDEDVVDDEDEVPFKDKKKTHPKTNKKEEEEEEDEEQPKKKTSTKQPASKKKEKELEWADLEDMEGSELADVIEAKDLDIDPEDYNDDNELRDAIAEELNIEKPIKKTKIPPAKKAPKVEEEEEDEDEEEEEKPAKKSKKPEKPVPTTNSTKCPHNHKFGIDTDKYDECEDCKIWDKCIDKKEGN